MKIEVRESRVPLVVGVLDMIVFVPFMLLSFWSTRQQSGLGEALAIAGLFGLFVLLGLALVLNYCNRRLVLTQSECHYTTWYGRTRTFLLGDIAQLECVCAVGNDTFMLRSRENKKLAQIESNMVGAHSASQWLRTQHIAIVERHVGALAHGEWDSHTWDAGNSWQMRHRRGIQCAVTAVSVATVVFAIAGTLLFSPKVRRTGWLLLPLILLALYFVFSEVIVLEKPTNASEKWKKSHISFPFFAYIIICLAALWDVEYIYLLDWGKGALLGAVVFSALGALYFRRIPKKQRGIAYNACILLFFLIYAFCSVYFINYVLRFAPPVHIDAAVVDGRVYRGTKSTSYYLTLHTPQGGETEYNVSAAMYRNGMQARGVQLCERESILGIRFALIHANADEAAP